MLRHFVSGLHICYLFRPISNNSYTPTAHVCFIVYALLRILDSLGLNLLEQTGYMFYYFLYSYEAHTYAASTYALILILGMLFLFPLQRLMIMCIKF